MLVDATFQFEKSFKLIDEGQNIVQMRNQLAQYYQNQFDKEHSKQNEGDSANALKYWAS